MRSVIVIALVLPLAGIGLAGCSSFSLDTFKSASAPPTVSVELASVPPGAEAKTSNGQSCKTPCSVNVPAGEAGFTVTFTMNKFQPATVPVQVIYNAGDFTTPATTTIEPNPVIAELKPAGPVKPVRGRPKPKKPKPAASAPPPAASPFPNPPPR